jgi:VWFA-related protein
MKMSAFRTLSLILILIFISSVSLAQRRKGRPIEEERDNPEGQATLRIEVAQVQVDITVRDKKSNLIQGLEEGHFKVYEDKVEQTITNFSPVEGPLTAVLVVEYRRAPYWQWEVVWEALQASYIFAEGMRRGDWMAVVAYDLRPEILVDFTQNPAEVYNGLKRLNQPAYREATLYDTVIDTLDRLEEVEGKVTMVVVSTGMDTLSKANLGELLKRLKRTNVVIYPVHLGGNLLTRSEQYMNGPLRMDFIQAKAVLREMAKSTGGESYFPRFLQSFPGVFQNIGALARSQYTLSYVSTNKSTKNKFRKLRVQVTVDINGDGKKDKLKVRHKAGYFPNTLPGS